jgi:hypothetical protein
MKKLLIALFAVSMIVCGVTAFAAEDAAEDVMLIMAAPADVIDAEKMVTDSIIIDGDKLDIAPVMGKMVEKDGVIFAPVRVVLETMGYQVSWTDAEKMVMAVNPLNGTILVMQVDNALLFTTQEQEEGKITMEAPSFLNLDECRTYAPVNALAQALGYNVGFDAEINTVTLSK